MLPVKFKSPAVVVAPPKLVVKLSKTVNAAVPALFCTNKDVVADVEPLPFTCSRAVGDSSPIPMFWELVIVIAIDAEPVLNSKPEPAVLAILMFSLKKQSFKHIYNPR